jgi:hypothetical protein
MLDTLCMANMLTDTIGDTNPYTHAVVAIDPSLRPHEENFRVASYLAHLPGVTHADVTDRRPLLGLKQSQSPDERCYTAILQLYFE